MHGQRLKKLLRERGVTQKELSEKLSIPETTVSGWTRQQYPPLENIEKCCQALGVPLWQFFLDNPHEVAEHPINKLHPTDVEILLLVYNLPDEFQVFWLTVLRDAALFMNKWLKEHPSAAGA